MLEYLAIFTHGGALLWTFGQLLNIKGDPVNFLIQNCLLEDRGGEGGHVYRPPGGTPYTLKWTFHNVWSHLSTTTARPGMYSIAAKVIELER